jgi:hypothetical protein
VKLHRAHFPSIYAAARSRLSRHHHFLASVWVARRLVQVVTAVAFPFLLANSSFAASVDAFFKSPIEEPAVFFCHTAKFLILEYD